jgi:hypothetical protein
MCGRPDEDARRAPARSHEGQVPDVSALLHPAAKTLGRASFPAMSVLRALLLFAIAAVAAIGGAWLIWLATEGRMAAALWRPSKQDTPGSSGRAT